MDAGDPSRRDAQPRHAARSPSDRAVKAGTASAHVVEAARWVQHRSATIQREAVELREQLANEDGCESPRRSRSASTISFEPDRLAAHSQHGSNDHPFDGAYLVGDELGCGLSHRYDEAIAAAMAELVGDVADSTPIEKMLFELTATAVRFIDGVDSADVLLIIKDGEFESHAATSPLATTIDESQQRLTEGPCLDAAERDVIVRSNDLRTESRWPRFAPEAAAAGVLSVMSFRLYTHGQDSGASNLFE